VSTQLRNDTEVGVQSTLSRNKCISNFCLCKPLSFHVCVCVCVCVIIKRKKVLLCQEMGYNDD